ncbi:hypothetical protein KZ483_14495 [Paenibacillus sp. sptzw28]|uniref:hypothetical protein n=1 Tax=Paenibacillus sp. sptzw28 TaxID=715179 RepID=UPI001C6ED738|nr:hypothetical protein [Paenibacillus sp. sptzw28]QYR19170.1 hypothetical protein KZ483_14495 [Paenibacillus sp. sptzw28]
MSTTFANLQIRYNSVHEIEKVLSGSIVKCLSDGWTTITSEHFQVGDIEKVAKKLSKAITPSVMSIEYVDDDILKMSIYRNGRTLTSHISGGDGHGLTNKLGKPEVFIEQLGFDSGEAKYLKAILVCEDLGKKIELLQHFLGVTIWIDHKMLCDDSVTDFRRKRDLSIIEQYIKEIRKKSRIKNQTEAILLQEFGGALIDVIGDHKYLIGIPPYDRSMECYKDEEIYTFIPSGSLEPMLNVNSFQHRNRDGSLRAAHGFIYYMSFIRGQYYLFDYKGRKIFETSMGGTYISPIHVLEGGGFLTFDDYEKTLREYNSSFEMRSEIPCGGFPFFSNNAIYVCRRDRSGQSAELVKLNRSGHVEASFRYDYDGYHDPSGNFLFDETGRVFFYYNATTPGKPLTKMFVLTEQMEIIKELHMEGWITSAALDSKNHRIFSNLSDMELIVIDTNSFLIVSRRKWEEDSILLTVDSCGRAVVLTGLSSIGLLDAQLNDISRHRLKGQVLSEFTNERGNLCLLTGIGGEHDEGGASSMKIRVYEICD